MRRRWIAMVLALALATLASAQTGLIKEVVVRGNKNISRDAILASMKSLPGKPFLQADLIADEQSVREMGFFRDVKVLSRGLNETEWQVIVEVDENPVIKEIRIAGNTVVPSREILPLVTQQVDQVFNMRSITPTNDAIAALYQKRGYFAQADVAPLEESPGTLNVQVIERAVNDIVITGLVRTKRHVVSRLMKTQPGQAFNEVKWINDRRTLDSTQWFESIEANSEPTGEIGKFNLLLDVKEARTGQIGFGAALDPRSRLAGSLRYSDNNFNGLGQTVGVTLQQDTFASTGPTVSLDFVNPVMDSRGTTLGVRLYSRINSYFGGSAFGGGSSGAGDRFDERRTGASISLSRPWREIYSATISASVDSSRTINELTTTVKDYLQQDGELVTVGLQVARDRRDVALDPAEGDYARISVEPAFANIRNVGGLLAGRTDLLGKHPFVRTVVEYKTFFSKRPTDPRKVMDPRRVIALRARAGYIKGTTPFFEQLFVGGADSLRGYPDQRYWGNRMLSASAEYRYPIQKSFNLTAFVDYGGAWGGSYPALNDFVQSSKMDLHLGYGVGVGFRTPLGPIRIDFGFNTQGGSRTHFSIGTSF